MFAVRKSFHDWLICCSDDKRITRPQHAAKRSLPKLRGNLRWQPKVEENSSQILVVRLIDKSAKSKIFTDVAIQASPNSTLLRT